jgi:hypothetical protein
METVEREEQLEFTGTGKIHKPVIALCLNKVGLVPRSEDFLADVLPPNGNDVPRIHVVKNDMDPGEIVSGYGRGLFYHETPAYDPIQHGPAKTVALHTSYHLPEVGEERIAA